MRVHARAKEGLRILEITEARRGARAEAEAFLSTDARVRRQFIREMLAGDREIDSCRWFIGLPTIGSSEYMRVSNLRCADCVVVRFE